MIDPQQEKTEQTIASSCYHCGDALDETISHDEHTFCCQGCVTVYDILKENNLENYYQLNSSPGSKIHQPEHHFDFLQDEKLVASLLSFKNENYERINLSLPSIHCSSCIWLLENLPGILPGVKESQVNFVKKEANILYDCTEVALLDLVKFLNSIGYSPDLNNGTNQNRSDSYSRKLITKLAVAGFFFGNSMLISLPHYIDHSFHEFERFSRYFGLLNLLFALPVILYAASDYFKNALTGLKHRMLVIDVPISLGIITLFIRSAYEILTYSGPGYIDSLCGLVFFLLIGKWYQNKTYKALSFDRNYKSFFPIAVNLTNGTYVPIEQLAIGDRVIIRNEEVLSADCVIISGESQVDYSFVTGESDLTTKGVGDTIYAGGKHFGSCIEVEIIKEVSSSYLTNLWDRVGEKKESDLQTAIDRISGYFTLSILVIAAATAVYWLNVAPDETWNAVSSVLIVACPCALALAVPITYGQALRVYGKEGFFLKNSLIIEQLSRLKLLVFDKTGTITSSSAKNIKWIGPQLTAESITIIHSMCVNSIHPLSRAIVKHLNWSQTTIVNDFHEEKGSGISATVNGLPVFIGQVNTNDMPDDYESRVYVIIDHVTLGYFQLNTDLKKGILNTLKTLRESYIMHLISGDHRHSGRQLIPYFNQLLFKQRPSDKLTHIERYNDKPIAMIGDGLNDAGALSVATVGIAVVDDLHQFSPSCDAILKGDQLVKLPQFLRFSKTTVKIVYLAFIVSFLYNIVGLTFAVTGNLTPLIAAVLMPISSVSVVGLVTVLVSRTARSLKK